MHSETIFGKRHSLLCGTPLQGLCLANGRVCGTSFQAQTYDVTKHHQSSVTIHHDMVAHHLTP